MRAMILAFVILLAQETPAQTPVGKNLENNTTTTIVGHAPGLRVSIAVNTRQVKTQELLGDLFIEGQFPEAVGIVQSLKLTVNEKDLFVPRSAYTDLIDVRRAELVLTQKSTAVILRGGDGSESYFVRIDFDKSTVKRRVLFSPAMPGKPLQETIYYVRVMEDR